MATKDYVGQYGETLRRLTALDASSGAFAQPQQIGGADVAPGAFGAPVAAQPGAFSAAAPAQPSMAGSAQPAPGAFSAPAPQPTGGAIAPQEKPTSWQDVTKHMPDEAKDQLADQIEQQVAGDLPSAYQQATQREGDKANKKASRRDMALYLAEVALRAFAAGGRPEQAIAQGALQTLDRREQVRAVAEERARREAETRRLEGREDTRDARKRGYEVGDKAEDRKFTAEEKEKDRKSAAYLEQLRLKAQALREKGQQSKIVVNDAGEYILIDDAGKAINVTTDVEETTTTGSRGQGSKTTTKTSKKPVKALPKPGTSGLDQDTILRQINERIKALKDDGKLVRELRKKGVVGMEADKAIEAEARRQVTAAAEEISGGGGKVIDFNDL